MKKNYIVSSLALLSLFSIQNILGMTATSTSDSKPNILDMNIASTPSVVGEQFFKEINHYDTLELFLINKLCKERINPGVRIDRATLSPNNDLIACAGEDEFFLWDRTTHTQVQQFPKDAGERISQITFADDGSHLAIATHPHTMHGNSRVRIWNVQTGQLVFSLQDAYKIAFCPDNEHVILGKESAELWNIKENKKIHTFYDELLDGIEWLALKQDMLIAVKKNGCSIWDIVSKEMLETKESKAACRAQWFPDAKRYALHSQIFLTIEEHYMCEEWAHDEKTPLFSEKLVPTFELSSVGRSSLGIKSIYNKNFVSRVLLYSIPNKETQILQEYRATPNHLEFSSDGKLVLIVVNTNPCSWEKRSHTDEVVEISYNPIDIIDLKKLEHVERLLHHASPKQINLYEAFAFAIKKNARIHADQEQWKVYKSLPESIQEALKLYIKESPNTE